MCALEKNKRYLQITKTEGTDNSTIRLGRTVFGYCEGIFLHKPVWIKKIEGGYFRTSHVMNIDEDGVTFYTENSTYKYLWYDKDEFYKLLQSNDNS